QHGRGVVEAAHIDRTAQQEVEHRRRQGLVGEDDEDAMQAGDLEAREARRLLGLLVGLPAWKHQLGPDLALRPAPGWPQREPAAAVLLQHDAVAEAVR